MAGAKVPAFRPGDAAAAATKRGADHSGVPYGPGDAGALTGLGRSHGPAVRNSGARIADVLVVPKASRYLG